MTVLFFLVPVFSAALLAYFLTPLARKLAVRVGAIDHPGERKIHSVPTARLGGLAVVFALALVLAVLSLTNPPSTHRLQAEVYFALAVGLVPVVAISVIDDMRPQRAIVKFGFHLIGASLAVALGIHLNPVVHFI